MKAMNNEGGPAYRSRLGATYLGNGTCEFLVWAPLARNVDLLLEGSERRLELTPQADGYHQGRFEEILPGQLYRYELHQAARNAAQPLSRPDPASRIQPQGVHGPSGVTTSDYAWNDAGWSGLPLREYIIYEVHVGTATAEGTLEGLTQLLPYLKTLGVTAVELMPLAEFPGSRNWGYDGVCPFAVHHAYGGPAGLKKFVDACHSDGLAVILDVVYNHLGPEGNYLGDFGPYFTSAYRTPWGEAVNFDGADSDHVRRFFMENALGWIEEFHIDALRFDAVHGIFDFSARPFLEEVTAAMRMLTGILQRRIYAIAESALNDPRVIRPFEQGGLGFDSQWNDDFHHALHTLLTGEHSGYYVDFGRLDHFVKAWREGFVYTGEYSPFRRRRHGTAAGRQDATRFVVFSQNHDQIGNRLAGERLSALLNLEQLKFAAAAVLLSPFVPLLFMGEEYGEPAPFPYFISHGDPELVAAVRAGRKQEFKEFEWQAEPPDPQARQTFMSSKIDPRLRETGRHSTLFQFYQTLIVLRKRMESIRDPVRAGESVLAEPDREWIAVNSAGGHTLWLYFGSSDWKGFIPLPEGDWRKCLDSADARWMGPGSMVQAEAAAGNAGAECTLRPFQVVLWERFEGAARSKS